MYAITGATGKLGRLVLAGLSKMTDPSNIVAAVRDPTRAEDLVSEGIVVRQADYDCPTSLRSAFEGVDRLLLISSNAVGRRVTQHANVIAAAKAAGVATIFYTSMLHADTSPIALAEEHLRTEEALAASEMNTVVLRNGHYSENYLKGLAQTLESGVLFGSEGIDPIRSAPRSDYAIAAAIALAGDRVNVVYELAGDHTWTMPDLAVTISTLSGKPVVYQDIPEAKYRDGLVDVGIPLVAAKIIANPAAPVATEARAHDGQTLATLLGRPTTPMSQVVEAALKSAGHNMRTSHHAAAETSPKKRKYYGI